MKKFLSFLFALSLCCILTACGGGQDAADNGSLSVLTAAHVISGGSGFSNTIRTIENAESNATVLEGLSPHDNRIPHAGNDAAD